MKARLASALLFFSFSAAHAFQVKLPKDALALTPAQVELVSTKPLCPEDLTCVANGTIVRLVIRLQGCLDEATPISYVVAKKEDGTNVLHVSAMNIARKASMTVRCVAPPVAFAELALINAYGPFEIQNMSQVLPNP